MLALRPALVSVSFGEYAEPVRRLREAGITTATQVCSVADLDEALDAGVDVVVVRGAEGGGHGRDAMATLPLLQLVLERTDLPVYAAGGILNHRGLAAVLAAGAAGAWVGTAFLGCVEAAGSPAAKAALFAAEQTGYGRVFDVAQQAAWPREYGGRAVANAYFDEWVGREDDLDDAARDRFRAGVAAGDFSVAHAYAGEGVAAPDRGGHRGRGGRRVRPGAAGWVIRGRPMSRNSRLWHEVSRHQREFHRPGGETVPPPSLPATRSANASALSGHTSRYSPGSISSTSPTTRRPSYSRRSTRP